MSARYREGERAARVSSSPEFLTASWLYGARKQLGRIFITGRDSGETSLDLISLLRLPEDGGVLVLFGLFRSVVASGAGWVLPRSQC